MGLVSIRVFHVMRDYCHVAYTTSPSKLLVMLEEVGTTVETITVLAPSDICEDTLASFHQIEYYDHDALCFERINVFSAGQVLNALRSLEHRVDLDGVSIYHHQVIL